MEETRTLPEPIERVRMALAEMGYQPSAVSPSTMRNGTVDIDHTVPWEDAWRASEVALLDEPMCLECCLERSMNAAWTGELPPAHCLTDRRCVLDCGVVR